MSVAPEIELAPGTSDVARKKEPGAADTEVIEGTVETPCPSEIEGNPLLALTAVV